MAPNLKGRLAYSIEKEAAATPITLEVLHPEERAYVRCPGDCGELIPTSVALCRECATQRVVEFMEAKR